MKKYISTPPASLFVTPSMAGVWEEFFGDSKMPRSSDKFLRKFIRASKNDLKDISLIFKGMVFEQFDDPPSVLFLVVAGTELMEYRLSQLYDECHWCRLRYRNGLERCIKRYHYFYQQAYRFSIVEESNRVALQTTVLETVLDTGYTLLSPKIFTNRIKNNLN